jgi:ubiquinone/menaquinone biosynthesis C-methylase UbiE
MDQPMNDTYFATIADSYDRMQPILAGPGYKRGLAMVVDLFPKHEHDKFMTLELGCGTGTLTRSILERFPNSRILGLDGESAMLDIARQKLTAFSERAEIRQTDIRTCELPECDVVVSSFMFHHIAPDDMASLLKRIAHKIRTGGCFILLDVILDQMAVGSVWGEQINAQIRRIHRDYTQAAIAIGKTTQQEVDARWAHKRAMKEQGQDIEFRHNVEDLLITMQKAGFSEVNLVWRYLNATILMGFTK